MLEAKKLQLETEGVTVRDSEISCGLRSFGTQDYEQAAKELLQKTGIYTRRQPPSIFGSS
jgi:hypothetical protein